MNVYDFDDTVYAGDSSIDFYKYCLKKHPVVLLAVGKQLFGIGLYIANIISKEKMKEYFFSFLKLLRNPDRDLDAFCEKNISRIKSFYLQKQNSNDVIISASPQFIIERFCNKLGVSKVHGTQMDIHSGKIYGSNLYGEQKKLLFDSLYNGECINEFYSDSKSDKWLADLAEHAFYVKGEKRVIWSDVKQNSENNMLEILRYSFWGVVSTVINLVIFYLMLKVGILYLVANFLSYVIAVFLSYLFNKKFVFEQEKSSVLGVLNYILVRFLAIGLETALLYILVDACELNVYFSKILTCITVMLLTYIANKLVVFNK